MVALVGLASCRRRDRLAWKVLTRMEKAFIALLGTAVGAGLVFVGFWAHFL
jgi:hypothetical protein